MTRADIRERFAGLRSCPRHPKRLRPVSGDDFLPPTVIRIRAFSASTGGNSPVGAPLRRKF